MKTIPILGFFRRYWLLTLFTLFFDWLALNDAAFAHVGSLIYITAMGSSGFWTCLFLRHLFFQSTLDLYAATGKFTDEFNGLEPWQRQLLAAVYFVGILIFLAFVVNGVGK